MSIEYDDAINTFDEVSELDDADEFVLNGRKRAPFSVLKNGLDLEAKLDADGLDAANAALVADSDSATATALSSQFVLLGDGDRVDGQVPVWDADAGEWVSGSSGGGEQGPPGAGVPDGGTTGQVLAKKSESNQDTEWVNQSGGGGGPGADGKSAYEVAVDEGFVGTEQEWLDSLVGPEGEPGSPGTTGAAGEPGSPGDPGPPGSPAIVQKDGEGWPADRPDVDGQILFSNTLDDDDTLPEWAVIGDIYVRRVDA